MGSGHLHERILAQLRLEERPPVYYEVGGLPQDRYPDLHERQIEQHAKPKHGRSGNRAWAEQRQRRVEEHAARVADHLRRHARRAVPGERTNGRRQRVWCVELRLPFASLSAAARFVGRAPTNVLQAMKSGVRCGPYHWERYDRARHGEATAEVPSVAADADVERGVSPGPPAPAEPSPLPMPSQTNPARRAEHDACGSEGGGRGGACSAPEQDDGRVGREGGDEREHGPVPVALHQPGR